MKVIQHTKLSICQKLRKTYRFIAHSGNFHNKVNEPNFLAKRINKPKGKGYMKAEIKKAIKRKKQVVLRLSGFVYALIFLFRRQSYLEWFKLLVVRKGQLSIQ